MHRWPSSHPVYIPFADSPEPLHFLHEPPFKPFPFFRLPTELRLKILRHLLIEPGLRAIDLGPDNILKARSRRNLFLANKRLHNEASHLFYRGNTFRILPTHGRFFKHGVKPLIPRLSQRCRDQVVSLELRLGPGWNSPPSSWVINHKLKLEKCHNVRVLKVFVECDPSQPSFKGFRISETFFTDFAGGLTKETIRRLPSLEVVSFETFPSVQWDGDLMVRLQDEAKIAGKRLVHIREDDEDARVPFKTKRNSGGRRDLTVVELRQKMMADSHFIIKASQLQRHSASIAEEVH